MDSPKLGQDVASKKFDRSRVVRVGGADDDVLDASLGQSAEPLDDLTRGTGFTTRVKPLDARYGTKAYGIVTVGPVPAEHRALECHPGG